MIALPVIWLRCEVKTVRTVFNAVTVLVLLMCLGCGQSTSDPKAWVRIEEYRVLDHNLDLAVYNKANLAIKDRISEAGESGVVACYLVPRELEWIRVTIYYLDPKAVSRETQAEIDKFEPYAYK